jgi:hypothetical protein
VAALWAALAAAPALAQDGQPYSPLSVREKTALLGLAREPAAAALESRPAQDIRPSGSMARLNQSQRLVLSVLVDGQVIARAWELRSPGTLQATAASLGRRIVSGPDVGRPPTAEQWPRAKFGLAVIHQLQEVEDDKAAAQGYALVALVDFTFAVGLPSDMVGAGTGARAPAYRNFDLYSRACGASGLRPTAWLGERATIFAGPVEEFFEN